MEPLYVNPEALGGLAQPYYAAGENYQHIGESYNDLLPKFKEGFGSDDTGQAFYQHFIKGAIELGQRVKNLEDAMRYCGEGLTQTSELYGQAEDDAEQSSRAFNKDVDENLGGTGQQGPTAVKAVLPEDCQQPPQRLAFTHSPRRDRQEPQQLAVLHSVPEDQQQPPRRQARRATVPEHRRQPQGTAVTHPAQEDQQQPPRRQARRITVPEDHQPPHGHATVTHPVPDHHQ